MRHLSLFFGILICSQLLTGAAAPTNVILIMADDIGFECFSSYGSQEYSTPRLDALAADGIRFENCHSTPLCTPSRVNLMSGKSNVYNYQDFGVYPKGEPTFANHFKKFGYATAVAGKWQLIGAGKGIMPKDAGFDTHCLWNIPGTTRERFWDPSLIQDGKLLTLPKGAYGP
ncbi:sulfatase-like hydrolase/transferase, partial [Verrucomicrobia bacterium]|nr:sulfatase-like hydrolase/transferase [Verrucomicrobiota bacterium]